MIFCRRRPGQEIPHPCALRRWRGHLAAIPPCLYRRLVCHQQRIEKKLSRSPVQDVGARISAMLGQSQPSRGNFTPTGEPKSRAEFITVEIRRFTLTRIGPIFGQGSKRDITPAVSSNRSLLCLALPQSCGWKWHPRQILSVSSSFLGHRGRI